MFQVLSIENIKYSDLYKTDNALENESVYAAFSYKGLVLLPQHIFFQISSIILQAEQSLRYQDRNVVFLSFISMTSIAKITSTFDDLPSLALSQESTSVRKVYALCYR